MTPTCTICERSEKTSAYDPLLRLYHCVDCDHTFTLIDEKYKEKNIYTEDYFSSSQKNWFKNPNFALFQYIHKVAVTEIKKRPVKLLDVGSGTGALLGYLHKIDHAFDLTGIDVAPCKSADFKFIQGDFIKTQIKDKFDVVTSLACIEHVDDPDGFVKKLKSLIEPDGLLIIMTINTGGMMYGLARMLNKIGFSSGYNRLYSDHHIHHFTNRSFRLLLEKHGFSLLSQKNHNYSLASVDYPAAGPVTLLLYKTLTAIIFFLSSLCRNGMSQTAVCVPNRNP